MKTEGISNNLNKKITSQINAVKVKKIDTEEHKSVKHKLDPKNKNLDVLVQPASSGKKQSLKSQNVKFSLKDEIKDLKKKIEGLEKLKAFAVVSYIEESSSKNLEISMKKLETYLDDPVSIKIDEKYYCYFKPKGIRPTDSYNRPFDNFTYDVGKRAKEKLIEGIENIRSKIIELESCSSAPKSKKDVSYNKNVDFVVTKQDKNIRIKDIHQLNDGISLAISDEKNDQNKPEQISSFKYNSKLTTTNKKALETIEVIKKVDSRKIFMLSEEKNLTLEDIKKIKKNVQKENFYEVKYRDKSYYFFENIEGPFGKTSKKQLEELNFEVISNRITSKRINVIAEEIKKGIEDDAGAYVKTPAKKSPRKSTIDCVYVDNGKNNINIGSATDVSTQCDTVYFSSSDLHSLNSDILDYDNENPEIELESNSTENLYNIHKSKSKQNSPIREKSARKLHKRHNNFTPRLKEKDIGDCYHSYIFSDELVEIRALKRKIFSIMRRINLLLMILRNIKITDKHRIDLLIGPVLRNIRVKLSHNT